MFINMNKQDQFQLSCKNTSCRSLLPMGTMPHLLSTTLVWLRQGAPNNHSNSARSSQTRVAHRLTA